MKEPAIGVHQTIIPDGQSPEVSQLANRALHNPAAAIPAQPASILVGRALVVGSSRNNRLNPTSDEQRPGGIAIIGTVSNQSVGPLAGRPGWCERVTATVSRVASRSRTSAGDAASRYAPSGVPVPSTNTIHFVPLPRLVGPLWRPLCRRGEAPIHEAFVPAELLSVIELSQEGAPQREQYARGFLTGNALFISTSFWCNLA